MEDDLSSARGIDYSMLRDFLKAGKWKEADEETIARMLEAAGREEKRVLEERSINEFPCEDLRTIDRLWVKYSEGHFGFSVQAEIYCSLGGTQSCDEQIDEKIWEAFADRVGWRKQGSWLLYPDPNLTFNTSAPSVTFHGVM
uniref:GUN4 domain-containing protein n=1 Tax=Desertifilum tharense IPPAS B-1220 TaxID=1781255 RepID=A0ACD5GR28_9CYAN